jgi:peptidoglycan/LPS O-acetylase OafA/YrhL
MLRSTLAIIGGYLAMVAVVGLCTYGLMLLTPSWFPGAAPPAGPFLAVNIAYSVIAALAGGYVAAWIAPQRPVKHAVMLAVFALVMSIVSAVLQGDRQPRWYQVLLAVCMPMVIVLGGWVRGHQRSRHGTESND